jgi:protoheme IX farnesyltransferase
MACGSMALNQVQERHIDERMSRTRNRPLPLKQISVLNATLFALILILIGVGILLIAGWLTALMGLFTTIYYNFVYTPLKQKTAFAAVPGSVVGALPPVIGWLAAGGSPADYRIWMLACFFFMGQIPHFWLLLLMTGKDYEQAGLPSLTKIFTESQIRRLSLNWIVWTGLTAVFMSMFGLTTNPWATWSLGIMSVMAIIGFIILFNTTKFKSNYRMHFLLLNSFYMLVMILLWVDGVVN